jgi:hypothetical protein
LESDGIDDIQQPLHVGQKKDGGAHAIEVTLFGGKINLARG